KKLCRTWHPTVAMPVWLWQTEAAEAPGKQTSSTPTEYGQHGGRSASKHKSLSYQTRRAQAEMQGTKPRRNIPQCRSIPQPSCPGDPAPTQGWKTPPGSPNPPGKPQLLPYKDVQTGESFFSTL
ncbi:hypothetical protein CHARACLAT_018934, partial [Characodon lateralis]|nr:hypothetical protein [Characodon lateralis]